MTQVRERDSGELPPVLILAAGKGTRLGELGRHCAKVLVPIDGRPLLDLQLEYLAREGVRRVVINAHHLSNQITAHVRKYHGPLKITVVVERHLLGTAGAAINALPSLGRETFFVLYGDVLIFEPLAPVLQTHAEAGAAATLCVYPHEDPRDKGIVEIDGRGQVVSFAEKDPDQAGPGLVNAGLYVIEPSLLVGFQRETFLDFGHDVFPACLRAGQHLQVYRLPREVLDIGTLKDL
ncbi:MAG: nucleotidyltransferase family protein, partial [Solirubrobacterales bacterium]|nr:nucleotidyltransferase family protein [Solirubrobacterales bacterium]